MDGVREVRFFGGMRLRDNRGVRSFISPYHERNQIAAASLTPSVLP